MGIGGAVNRIIAWLMVSVLSAPLIAADAGGPLAVSVSREAKRVGSSMPAPSRLAQPAQVQPKRNGWVARHPKLFGALAGFGVGCGVGAARVGGSEDNFFNALDEFACPVVGGIGAGVGAFVGSLVR